VLIDFGSARDTSRNPNTIYTQIFSGGYAPIEQISGTEQGAYSDVYAVGAVCYRAIGGSVVDAFTRQQAKLRGRPDPLPPAAQLGIARYPMRLLQAIDLALAVNPEDRPQSAIDLLARLGDATGADDKTVLIAENRPGSDGRAAARAAPPPATRRVFDRWKGAAVAAGIVVIAALGIGAAVFVAGRAEPEEDVWAKLLANPNDAGFQSYLQHFPHGAHGSEAQARLTALADAKAWTDASAAASEAGYRAYLSRFPEGTYKSEAQARLDEIARLSGAAEAQLWTEVSAKGTEAGYQSYLERFPQGLHRGSAEAHLAALAEWRKLRDTGSSDDVAAFLSRHPDEPFAEDGRQRLAALRRAEAEAAWDRIKGADDQKALQGYLDKYPASPHDNDAKQRLAVLRGRQAAAAWANVKDSTDSQVVQAYLNDYPGSPFEPLAKARLAEIKRRAETRGSNALPAKP